MGPHNPGVGRGNSGHPPESRLLEVLSPLWFFIFPGPCPTLFAQNPWRGAGLVSYFVCVFNTNTHNDSVGDLSHMPKWSYFVYTVLVWHLAAFFLFAFPFLQKPSLSPC